MMSPLRVLEQNLRRLWIHVSLVSVNDPRSRDAPTRCFYRAFGGPPPFQVSLILFERIRASPNQANLAIGKEIPLTPGVDVSDAQRTLRNVSLRDLDYRCALRIVEAVTLNGPTGKKERATPGQ
jgi:hypothetical protein